MPPTITINGNRFHGSLQQAIQNAPQSADIHLSAGQYPGPLIIDKDVSITGDDWEGVVVVGQEQSPAVRVHAGCLNLEMMTILSPRAEKTVGILITSGTLKAWSTVIRDASTGIDLAGRQSEVTLQACVLTGLGVAVHAQGGKTTIEKTLLSSNAWGINCDGSGTLVNVDACKFENHPLVAVSINGQSRGQLEGCSFIHNGDVNLIFKTQVACVGESELEMVNCVVEQGDAIGVIVSEGSKALLDHCTIRKNKFAGMELGGASLILKNSIVRENKLGLSLKASRLNGDNLEIAANEMSGVEAIDRSTVAIQSSKITNNSLFGVALFEGSSGTLQDCACDSNGRGPWVADKTAKLNLPRRC